MLFFIEIIKYYGHITCKPKVAVISDKIKVIFLYAPII
jgi:hypothetical protein